MPSGVLTSWTQQRLDRAPFIHLESIARELGLSVSWFHHHFKAITGMSPLQFQKRLRLQETRRLMLGDGLDATSAASRVGYHNAAHFNREYKSLFLQCVMWNDYAGRPGKHQPGKLICRSACFLLFEMGNK